MEQQGEERKQLDINEGFVKVPQRVMNGLLVINLSKRDFKLLLLITRLTYGCHRQWAHLRLIDLKAVGIPESHGSEVLNSLMEEKIIIRNAFNKREYKINEELFVNATVNFESYDGRLLSSLIGKHLFTKSSSTRKESSTKQVNNYSQKQESTTSQNSKQNMAYNNEIYGQIQQKTPLDKDNDIKNRYKDRKILGEISGKIGSGQEVILDPNMYSPKSIFEQKALSTWQSIEPDNPRSFGYYVFAIVKKEVPFNVIDRITSEALTNPKVQNKGKFFVSKVQDYLYSDENENTF